MSITLHSSQGEAVTIGQVAFQTTGDGTAFTLTLDEALFEDHFLSMRPFKCLPGPTEMLCHLPYPYALTRVVTADDLSALEYELLFIRKQTSEYGIDPWNGRYYVLRLADGGLEGLLHEVDLNVLAAPPEAGNLRPIERNSLHEATGDTHWMPRMTIR